MAIGPAPDGHFLFIELLSSLDEFPFVLSSFESDFGIGAIRELVDQLDGMSKTDELGLGSKWLEGSEGTLYARYWRAVRPMECFKRHSSSNWLVKLKVSA